MFFILLFFGIWGFSLLSKSDYWKTRGLLKNHNTCSYMEFSMLKAIWVKIQLWAESTRDMVSSKLEFFNIMTNSILSTWCTDMDVSARACFLLLSFVVLLPYKSIRVNDLCISLIPIYTPSQTHHSVHRNFYWRVVIV